MQYQVPQFIDTEDKVVGPFSLRQFAYVGGAALVSAIAYFILQTWLSIIIAIVLIGGSLAISFIRINGRPLINVIISAANFYWKPQIYVWKPDRPVQTQKRSATTEKEPAKIPVSHTKPHLSPVSMSFPDRSPSPVSSPTPSTVSAPAVTSSRTPATSPRTAIAIQARQEERPAKTVEEIASGDALHKSWQDLQTGTRPGGRLESANQFLERKMAERYQIFQRLGGDRAAARRVDYR